jgi:hypothetical protein
LGIDHNIFLKILFYNPLKKIEIHFYLIFILTILCINSTFASHIVFKHRSKYTFLPDSNIMNCASFGIKLSKNQYFEAEPIWLELNAEIFDSCKLSRKPYLKPGMDVILNVTDSNGTILRDHWERSYVFINNFPRKVFSISDLLWNIYDTATLSMKYLYAGTYKVSAYLIVLNSFGIPGMIESDTLSFNILKPIGAEIKAFQSFAKVIATIDKEKFLKISEEKMLKDFLRRYPKSVYSDKVKSILNFYIFGFDWDSVYSREKKSDFILNCINDNQNSCFIDEYLHDLYSLSRFDDDELRNNPLQVKQNSLKLFYQLRNTFSSVLVQKLCDLYIFELTEDIEKIKNK